MTLKIQYLVMEDTRWHSAGNEIHRFDTYEEAEKKILAIIDKFPADLMGSAPVYWIKKVYTV